MSWSGDKTVDKVRARSYYAGALFAVFSIVVVFVAYSAPDMSWFLALYSAGAAVVAIMCYISLTSAINRAAAKREDVGSTCATSTAHDVGSCPDSHITSGGKCILREEPLHTGGSVYWLDQSVDEPVAAENGRFRTIADIDGLDTQTLRELCSKFGKHPYTALLRMDQSCVRT